MNNQQKFYTTLTGLAGMVPGFTLSPEVIAIYDQHLEVLGYDRVCKALDRIIVERNSKDPFPSVKEIRMTIDPELDPDQEAMVIASRIVGAVSRIGPYQSALAKLILGETGWKIVQYEGGWENICQTLTYENQGIMKAQWRNLAKTLIARGDHESMSLPEPKQKAELRQFGVNLKSIPMSDSRGEIE